MSTRHRGTRPRLRAYHRELTERYQQALARRDWAGARRIYDHRHRVWVALLQHEEWNGVPPQSTAVAMADATSPR